MGSLTPVQGLKTPAGTDPFLRQDYIDNLDTIDASPGAFICTSTTHPTTWGTSQVGRTIIEQDTGKILTWTSAGNFVAPYASDPNMAHTLTNVGNLITGHNSLITAVDYGLPYYHQAAALNTSIAASGSYTWTSNPWTFNAAGPGSLTVWQLDFEAAMGFTGSGQKITAQGNLGSTSSNVTNATTGYSCVLQMGGVNSGSGANGTFRMKGLLGGYRQPGTGSQMVFTCGFSVGTGAQPVVIGGVRLWVMCVGGTDPSGEPALPSAIVPAN